MRVYAATAAVANPNDDGDCVEPRENSVRKVDVVVVAVQRELARIVQIAPPRSSPGGPPCRSSQFRTETEEDVVSKRRRRGGATARARGPVESCCSRRHCPTAARGRTLDRHCTQTAPSKGEQIRTADTRARAGLPMTETIVKNAAHFSVTDGPITGNSRSVALSAIRSSEAGPTPTDFDAIYDEYFSVRLAHGTTHGRLQPMRSTTSVRRCSSSSIAGSANSKDDRRSKLGFSGS